MPLISKASPVQVEEETDGDRLIQETAAKTEIVTAVVVCVCRWIIATQCRHQTTSNRSCVFARCVLHSWGSMTTTVVLLTTSVASYMLDSSHSDQSWPICRSALCCFSSPL